MKPLLGTKNLNLNRSAHSRNLNKLNQPNLQSKISYLNEIKVKIVVNDRMQTNYIYYLTQPVGQNFDPQFTPELTPAQMLKLGIFGGRYLRDCRSEFPADWFAEAIFQPLNLPGHDAKLNYYQVEASQSLAVWRQRGWIHPDDPRGWFQWYCRYYLGRRHEDDGRQINRWRAMKRHLIQLKKNCLPFDETCRRKQRQALLHWAYDSRKI